MGKQIMFHMLPEDCDAFLEFLSGRDPIVFTLRDADSPDVEAVRTPCLEWNTLAVWNQSLLPALRREYIENADKGPYYRVDDSLPVLEFSPSHLTEWAGSPALLQGRIWGAFENPDRVYRSWFDAIARWMRKHYRRDESLEGYVAQSVQSWQQQGGLLLPMFKPPVTETWRTFFQSQLAAAGKL